LFKQQQIYDIELNDSIIADIVHSIQTVCKPVGELARVLLSFKRPTGLELELQGSRPTDIDFVSVVYLRKRSDQVGSNRIAESLVWWYNVYL